MSRYFIEVEYLGTHFSGFQSQPNTTTVQGEIDRSLSTLLKTTIETTTSSRTDAGVHAFQNFLHFDTEITIPQSLLYNINSILPRSLIVNCLYEVRPEAHCRFDAKSRTYLYKIHTKQDAFAHDLSYYYPYQLDIDKMNQACLALLNHTEYAAFAKKHSTAKTTTCHIKTAFWSQYDHRIFFEVSANRFLRGMVRALVATMIQVGRGKMSLEEFNKLLYETDNQMADFSAPAHGLYLKEVNYDSSLLENMVLSK